MDVASVQTGGHRRRHEKRCSCFPNESYFQSTRHAASGTTEGMKNGALLAVEGFIFIPRSNTLSGK